MFDNVYTVADKKDKNIIQTTIFSSTEMKMKIMRAVTINIENKIKVHQIHTIR